jgi:hypothetical protein
MTQNSVRLPPNMYEALRRKAAAQHKSPDSLVVEWLAPHLETDWDRNGDVVPAFEREVAAFEALKPSLLVQYEGQFVAIYQGKVVTSGDDKFVLSRKVRERYGPVICYIEKVTDETPRTARIPSVWVVEE